MNRKPLLFVAIALSLGCSTTEPGQEPDEGSSSVSESLAVTTPQLFRDRSTPEVSPDWDSCHGKATCATGSALVGISVWSGDRQGRNALCRQKGSDMLLGNQAAVLFAADGDARRATRSVAGSTDWDPGNYKLECGRGEYVSGVSENAGGCQGNLRFHGVRCSSGVGLPDATREACVVRTFDGKDHRGTTTSGDWSPGDFKGECGLDEYLAGVSVSPSTGGPRSLLCCSHFPGPAASYRFRDASEPAGAPDWDFCHGRATCSAGEMLSGIAVSPSDGQGDRAVCRREGNARFTGQIAADLNLDAFGDHRRAYRSVWRGGVSTSDWDPGYAKLECGTGEYVAGMSENALSCQGNHALHAIRCGQGAGLDSGLCTVRLVGGGDERGTQTTGEWAFGDFKTECGLDEYLAGVSAAFGSGAPHALLCCNKEAPSRTFLQRSGRSLTLDGVPFRFVGVNSSGLAHFGMPPRPYAQPDQMELQLAEAARMGARVVRLFAAGNYASRSQLADRLGAVLDAASRHDVYVIAAFTDLYGDTPFHPQGDDGMYEGSGLPVLGNCFFTSNCFGSPGYRRNYLPWVQTVVARFKNHPRLLGWELGNEIKYPSDPAAFIRFADEVARTIRAVDRQHLVLPGSISTWAQAFTSDQALCFYGAADACSRAGLPNPSIDVVITHNYDGEGNPNIQPSYWQRRNDVAIAQAVNRPLIIEEAGYSCPENLGAGYCTSLNRPAKANNDLSFWTGQGAAGYMQWGFTARPIYYDIGEGDRTSGMDNAASWHPDYDGLFGVYRSWAESLR